MTEEFDLPLDTGRLHGERRGPKDAPAVLCLHGLSANLRGFDFLAERLAGPERQVIALDLRGRGRSEITPPGTYGLDVHARDVLEAATRLEIDRFDLIGWSMGAIIGLHVAHLAPERLRRLALVDHVGGAMDDEAVDLVIRGLNRLDAVVPAPEAYVDAVRAAGAIDPWNEYWDRFYRYELGPHPDGVTPITSKDACLEDMRSIEGEDVTRLWPAATMPVLLLRATVPLGGGGLIVPGDVRDAFTRAVAHAEVVEIDGNHWTLMADERAPAAIRAFLD
jgi:pimeloyl-ACP methyl ester carboxylesterase